LSLLRWGASRDLGAWRDREERRVILTAHGVRVELPHGWSGRLFSRDGELATLHTGNFPLALNDGEFGDRSTSVMRSGAAFIALTEYHVGAGLKPGSGLFASRRVPTPLDPAAFAAAGLAHPRPGQVGMQHFFTASRRPFCLYVVLAGSRENRRRRLLALDHVLSSLRIDERRTG
jgi:hypothetical protein